ncbi:MAG: hypothetical protein HRU11_02615 [Parvularculaceae bacterium]|nr:hypothetical protein [Parvularculaceae bacterium]
MTQRSSLPLFGSLPVPLPYAKLLLATIMAIVLCLWIGSYNNRANFIDSTMVLPDDERASVFVGAYAEYIEETDGTLDLQAVQAREDWQKVEQRFISFGGITKPVWVRARLANPSDEPVTVRFDTRRVAFKEFAITLSNQAMGQERTILDYRYEDPFADRPVQHRMLVADAELAPGEEVWVFIRYRGIYNSVLPLRVATPDAFEKADKHEMFWSAQFYGVCCAMIFLTLLTSPLIGFRLSISFGAFLLTGLLTTLSVEGYIDQFVVPVKTGMAPRVTDCIYLLHYCSILLFGKEVFNLKSYGTILDKALTYAIGAGLVLFVVHLFIGINERSVFVPLALVLRAVSLILLTAVGVWATLNDQRGATAFTASAMLIAGASIYMVVDETFGYSIGGIPTTMRLLMTLEAMSFAIAITLSVVNLKRERDQAVQADLLATKEKLRLSTELQQSREAYGKARDQAGQYLERLRSVGHDILQPLASLRATFKALPAQSVAEGASIDEAFNYLESLARDGNRDSSHHAEAAQAQETKTPVRRVLSSVAAMFREEAEAKGLTLEASIDDAGFEVADPVPLMRAVSNFVANSIRYTDQGTVTLRCEPTDVGLLIRVQDTGRGMSAGELARFRLRHEKSAQSPGSGLGLAIAQDAADQLGAVLEIVSEVGAGTTASLSLPMAAKGSVQVKQPAVG